MQRINRKEFGNSSIEEQAKSAFEIGQEAFKNSITAPVLDAIMMRRLNDNTSNEVGSGIDEMKKWWDGWYFEQEKVSEAEIKAISLEQA